MKFKENKKMFVNFLKQTNTLQKVFIFIVCCLYPLFAMICLIGFFIFKDYK